VAKGTKWQRVKRGVESVVSCLLIAGSEKDRDSSGDDGGEMVKPRKEHRQSEAGRVSFRAC